MREQLLERVQALALKLSHLGIESDLAALSIADLLGTYWYLRRMAEGG
jgi:hypothetical protein